MTERGRIIGSRDLQRRLVRVAQIRMLICIAAFVAGLAVASVVSIFVGRPEHPAAAAAIVFGPFLLAAWITGRTYCRRAVRCPHCDAGLWSCGTENFKPRRMKVIGGNCPSCYAAIV